MKLLTLKLRSQIPALYAQDGNPDAIAYVKFFTPDSNRTWYASEFDGTDRFFGLIQGSEEELGYFSLLELQSVRGRLGLPVERDLYFKPTPISQLLNAQS